MIEIKNLNYNYPSSGKGIFDIDFEVRKGQVVGFLGPNGAGKTTTIRCILGFMKAQSGTVTVNGIDCFNNAPQVAKYVGYIAGEPSFPDGMSGIEFLRFLIDLRISEQGEVKEGENKLDKEILTQRMNTLVQYFELNANTKIKRMSKGMKQKTAIVAAFMHDPEVIILDEPTSGLDPLMQAKFIDMLQNEKKRGKTILISSHMFAEIERTADRVLIIRDGRIVAEDQVKNLKKAQRKSFYVTGDGIGERAGNAKDEIFSKMPKDFVINVLAENEVEFSVQTNEVDSFVKFISKLKVEDISKKEIKLEEVFMQYYKQDQQVEQGGIS
ncbi:MAG: ABC transporter ATP-binding protein [Firmicutes bacterium]|nr:ABC transporter ATP-binding protein [Bacillota bacterium]